MTIISPDEPILIKDKVNLSFHFAWFLSKIFNLYRLYFQKFTLGATIMFTVKMEKECGCFKRSGIKNSKTFDNRDDAMQEAKEWAEEMNETFCKKHNFTIAEEGNDLIIKVDMN
jgi:sulfur relay (sulfurtransferase) DsrC/TusE family protein